MCVPRLLLATPLLLVIISMADASRILVVFSIPTKSHIKMCEGISIALAEAGHEVTMVTPLEYHNPKLPNLVPVVLTGMSEKHEQDLDTLELHDLKESPLFTISVIVHDSVHSSADTLFHPNMRKLLDYWRILQLRQFLGWANTLVPQLLRFPHLARLSGRIIWSEIQLLCRTFHMPFPRIHLG